MARKRHCRAGGSNPRRTLLLFPKISLKTPRSMPTNREHQTAVTAVSKARLVRAKKPRSAMREGTKHAQFDARGPARLQAGGEARTKACRRGVQRGVLSPLPTTRPFTEAPHAHQVDDWACGVVKGLQRRAVPLRTSKGSTFSRRTRGSCPDFEQEVGKVSSALSCEL